MQLCTVVLINNIFRPSIDLCLLIIIIVIVFTNRALLSSHVYCFCTDSSLNMEPNRTFKKLTIHKLSNDIREAGQVTEAKLKPPEKGQILVRNHYAGVNAIDMNIITGRSKLFKGALPFDSGMEGLGVIEAIGEGVDGTRYSIGQAGLILANSPKAYSQYIYAKAEEFFPVPEIKAEYLALLDCGLTASIGLDKSAVIKPAEIVLITAAAGGTGHIAVQWAKSKGCKVIGLCSTANKAAFLSSIGCDRVINYKEDNVDHILSSEFPNGIDVIWETIGGAMFETLFNHLAMGGRIVIVGAISGYKTVGFPEISILNLPTKLLNKSASIIGFRFRHFEQHFEHYLNELIELYRRKALTIRLDTNNASGTLFTGIDSVIDAIEHQQSGKNLGKVIVKIE